MRALRCTVPLLIALCSGCYFAKLAGRQLELMNDQRPLPRALADEIDPERRRLLALVPDLRAFGRDRMQLPVDGSYAGYYATEQKGIAFVLVGSERTRLAAYKWWFPVVGEVAYKSFVDEADARDAERELQRAGYDAWVGRVTAYSTLGFFRDPVTTVMMRKGLVAFVEVLLHEMAHARLYVPGHTDWNEQLASFAGRVGAEQYLRSRYAGNREVLAELLQRNQSRERFETAVSDALAEVEALYAAGRPAPVVLRKRQPVFARLERELVQLYPEEDRDELAINNAHLLQYRRYLADAREIEQLWLQARGSWADFWARCEQRAKQL